MIGAREHPLDEDVSASDQLELDSRAFDFAGRVFKSKPAPTNLEVPPHVYLSDTRIMIGEDKKGA